MNEKDEKIFSALAYLYGSQNLYVEAGAIFERALQSYERVQVPENRSILTIFHWLGNSYLNQGRLLEAEFMYKQALQGYEKVLGPGHILTLHTVSEYTQARDYRLDRRWRSTLGQMT